MRGSRLSWLAAGLLIVLVCVALGWAWWRTRTANPASASASAPSAILAISPAPPPQAPAAAAPPAHPAAPMPPPHRIGAAPATGPAPAPPPAQIALGPVPDPVLVQETPQGPLPVIGPKGKMAWQAYARPFADLAKRPRVAILLSNLGLDRKATEAAITDLPGAVTLGFLPYVHGLQNWITRARAAGHEVILELPMEPADYPSDDPGPHALLTSLSVKANLDRLDWQLSRAVGYIGATSYLGSKFTAEPDQIHPVLDALRRRGLMFLDRSGPERAPVARIARQIGLPLALGTRRIDTTLTAVAIDQSLVELDQAAADSGAAIGIGRPYPLTMHRIIAWARTLTSKGLALAPVSAIVNRQNGPQ